jgi:hypothetical protein
VAGKVVTSATGKDQKGQAKGKLKDAIEILVAG